MIITYHNLKIRNAEASDAAQLCSWWNNGTIMAHAGFPNGLGTNEEQVSRQLASCSDDKGRILIIEVDLSPIGEMSYQSRKRDMALYF